MTHAELLGKKLDDTKVLVGLLQRENTTTFSALLYHLYKTHTIDDIFTAVALLASMGKVLVMPDVNDIKLKWVSIS